MYYRSMKIDFDIDLKGLDEIPTKDGQVSIKLPKDQELRFKVLNTKHQKRLSSLTRDFMIKLMDTIETPQAS